jgi:quercetin dioxygenase-like cupin family protein
MKDKRQSATSTVMVDNDRVIVTEWRFAPDAETGWHRHRFDYVVVPQSTGTLLLESRDGERTAALESGQPYFRSAGVEHNVVNSSGHEFVFIELEIKDAN